MLNIKIIALLLICTTSHVLAFYSPNDPQFYKNVEILRQTTPAALAEYSEPMRNYAQGMKDFYGLGVEVNKKRGIEHFEKAAQENLTIAQSTLGEIYSTGLGITPDLHKAFHWLKKAVDADKSDDFALALLFTKPFKPLSNLNLNEVPEWRKFIENRDYQNKLRNRARQGNSEAKFALAILLMRGTEFFPKNSVAGLKLLTQAADQGHVLAQHMMSFIYQTGQEVPQNIPLALEYLKKSAQYSVIARYDYAVMLNRSNTPYTDIPEAIKLFKQLREMKFARACTQLAVLASLGINDQGLPMDPDYDKSFKLYEEAVNLGDNFALYDVASMYKQGLGTRANPEMAANLYKKIMRLNDPHLSLAKALMYEYGLGVAKNIEEAKKLYKQAAPLYPYAEIRFEELVNQEFALEQSTKKTKGKKKAETEPETPRAHQAGSSSSHAALADIDIAGEKLKAVLNNALHYEDKSIITDIDTHNNTITIKNPCDNSAVTITADRLKPITQQDLNSLIKFTYDDRVKKWFGPENQLRALYTQDQIARHSFAQRVDQIMQLYGRKAYFVKSDGTITTNIVLDAKIIGEKGNQLSGQLQYAFNKDVYHRFLHPNPNTQPNYPKAIAQ